MGSCLLLCAELACYCRQEHLMIFPDALQKARVVDIQMIVDTDPPQGPCLSFWSYPQQLMSQGLGAPGENERVQECMEFSFLCPVLYWSG